MSVVRVPTTLALTPAPSSINRTHCCCSLLGLPHERTLLSPKYTHTNERNTHLHNTILHMLRQARQHRDRHRVKALQVLLREHTPKISLPFHVSGTIIVPELSIVQNTVLANMVHKMLHRSYLKPHEPQAVRNTVRNVESHPHTVCSISQSRAMAQSRLTSRPPPIDALNSKK